MTACGGTYGMTPLEIINDFRERMDDVKTHSGPPPTGTTYRWEAYDQDLLWRNSELITYLNGAILEIGLRHPVTDDDTGEITAIELIPGQIQYGYDPCILAIDAVTLRSQDYPLFKTTRRTREIYHYGRSRRPTPLAPGVPTTAFGGHPVVYYEDSRERQLILDSEPTQTDYLDISVRRLYLGQACWDTRCNALPEPGPEYKEAIVQWMMSKAFNKRNCDAFDGNAARAAANEFTRIVGPTVSFEVWENRRFNANLTMRVGPKSYPGWRRPTYGYRYLW